MRNETLKSSGSISTGNRQIKNLRRLFCGRLRRLLIYKIQPIYYNYVYIYTQLPLVCD